MKHGLPDLESAIAAIDLSDYQTVDWSRVQHSAYLIHQHLRYEYPGPIQNLQQRLMILPPQQHGDQRLVDYRLTVTNPSVETTYRVDDFGNTEITICVPSVEHSIDFEAWILVERLAAAGPYYLSIRDLATPQYSKPSRLTHPDETLYEIAARFKADGKQEIELAHQINTWVYQTMSYAHEVTGIHTTAAEALALKQGVCQDYAHIMVTLCRLCALPARYVSGHLLGEGGTHAWVEVLLPVDEDPEVALVVPLDPTHGRPAGFNYVTVAMGNDYFDVAPMSGTYYAAYSGQLSTRKRVGLAMYTYMDTAPDKGNVRVLADTAGEFPIE
ncbi:MAG: transglutaminase family protein [Ktedonobacteraceae bacterium]|nr:transglutaminase family protein [Chloroflexota bacterium]